MLTHTGNTQVAMGTHIQTGRQVAGGHTYPYTGWVTMAKGQAQRRKLTLLTQGHIYIKSAQTRRSSRNSHKTEYITTPMSLGI